MKIGIVCPSEIAFRRFMPSLEKCSVFSFYGVGVCNRGERENCNSDEEYSLIKRRQIKKAKQFIKQFGGIIFDSYEEVVKSDKIEAVYIPLPPALHYKWAKLALENKKHVFLEKPSTVSQSQALELVNLAKANNLALYENYMFLLHNQIDSIDRIIDNGELGDIRLYRISFGFPRRNKDDFRYKKILGGGALMDAGGYTIRYAQHLLGNECRLISAHSNFIDGFEVDMFGTATIKNDSGLTAQLAFGMDNNYKCELEVWGSKGYLKTNRILTAPSGFIPTVVIQKGSEIENRLLPSDDAFLKSLNYFNSCIENRNMRIQSYESILQQMILIDEFKRIADIRI